MVSVSDTKTIHELTFEKPGLIVDQDRIANSYQAAKDAAEGDSNDGEISALNDLVDELMAYIGITVKEIEVPECDECDEQATWFWPNLTEPVQMCDSCTHNARRSGWEPGQ